MANVKKLVIAMTPTLIDEFIDPQELSDLQSSYSECVFLPPDQSPRAVWQQQLIDLRPNAVLTGWGTWPMPREVMPPLEILAHTAGSVRGLVNREMLERGLIVTNWGEHAAPAVAECALMLVLCCLRRVNQWSFVMHRDRGWVDGQSNDQGIGLYGRRVGLHGFGKIARQIVRLLAPFGCEIAAYSEGVPAAHFSDCGVREVASLANLFSESDIVVEVEALNDHTRGSVTGDVLRLLPRGGVFVNVGRGPVVDEAALEQLAIEGYLEIGLDVYVQEPLPAVSRFRGLPNVTLLPHIAGPTRDQRRACGRGATDALKRYATGDLPPNPVSLAEYDRST